MLPIEQTAFDQFYASKLEPELGRLREECKRADGWGMTALFSALLGFASFIGYHAEFLSGNTAAWLFAFFAVLVVIAVYKYSQRNDRFTEDYKAAVIKQIMDHIYPGLTYKPGEFVSHKEYKSSSLFRHRFDYYNGDDYIEGVIDNIPFHCSELHTECDYSMNVQMTIFKGLFMVAGINKRFNGGTYIWPRGGTQYANSLMDQYVRLMPMPKVAAIHFDDPQFTHYYHVCSTWPSQANEILTAEMRSKMVELREKLDCITSFSFVAGSCYIALPLSKDLLEPSDYDPGDKEEILKYFLTLQVIPEIIRQLPLETLQ
jgi:hypothetical protein